MINHVRTPNKVRRAMTGNNTIDRRMAEELSGTDKLRAMLTARHGSVGRWAVRNGFLPEELYMTLNGVRPYPKIRDRLAEDIGIDRAEVDALIGAARSEAAA